jgi:nitrate/nitrite-specific signal transduction histidine kinase
MADRREILDLFAKGEEWLEMFRRGRQFTEELLRENERLRLVVLGLEKEKIELTDSFVKEIEALRLENSQLASRLEFLSSRFQQIEAENKDFALRYLEVEEQNDALANLYVASYRLHSTLDPAEVVQAINEVLINMIGTEEFALFVVDDQVGELVFAGGEGTVRSERIRFGEGHEGLAAQTGKPFFADGDGLCACIPLKIKERVVGVIAIYRLLPHKKGLTALDHRLLELLAGHAATALVSSRLYAAADRKLKTIEGFITLLRAR